MLTQLSVSDVVATQRLFFTTEKTKQIAFRIAQLKLLKQAITENEKAITNALRQDLGKSEEEAYITEIAPCLAEINYAIKNVNSWAKPQKVGTPITHWPGSSAIYSEPLGVVLIIGAWNYPINLIICPLVGAIAAGNCTVLKPSEIAANTSHTLAEIISKYFDPGVLKVVEGEVETSKQLLEQKFDHIFFTGSTEVGKIVMSAAAKHLTPVTLELGGKSPSIVDADSNLEYAAKRIIWGKFLNAGQTCVAPDYLLVDRRIKSDLLQYLKKYITQFFGDNPATNPDFCRIINQKHFNRLCGLLKEGKIVTGGETNQAERYIAPTIIDGVDWDMPIMQEEIFGPLLPVLEYTDIKEAIALVNSKPKPLALYFFSSDKNKQEQVLTNTSSGGVCINDTVMHLGVMHLPFGGVGTSGMGNYHGKASFTTFSHQKSVFKNSFLLDLPLRYPPFAGKLPLLKSLLK